MRTKLTAILVAFSLATFVVAEEIPTPSVTRIGYDDPQQYVVLHPSFGNEHRIRDVAATLKAETVEQTLLAINRWIGENIDYDAEAAYEWRDFDAAVDGRCYGGCADYAVVFTALARACGIPTVFVKTMDVPWIHEFRRTGTCQMWSGHVFLEVYVNGEWRLLEPQACTLYDEYDPAMRILPGSRMAYDKGSDPRELVLSPDWEKWKQQTAAYFADYDLAQLPVGPGRVIASPDDVFIAANSPIWQALTKRCRELNYRVKMSFNTDFDNWLRSAKGCRLIVTCVGSDIVLPAARYDEYLPLAADKVRKKTASGESGMLSRRLDDGTRVVLVYAKDNSAMLELIRTLNLPSES